MLKRRLSQALGVLLLILSGGLFAQPVSQLVEVKAPYVRAVPPGQPNSASFLQLNNTDAKDHALVAAESPASKVVELHTHTMEGGMMRMRQVERIDLPAGAEVALQPGGLHVMLIGLQQDLVPGEAIPLTLIFEDGSRQQIQAPVQKLQMHMKLDGRAHHMDMQH